MDYPGIHIGPEPTTDKFIAVVHGDESKVIKGNSLTAVDELPYAGLSNFGGGFLNKFEAALANAPILKLFPVLSFSHLPFPISLQRDHHHRHTRGPLW
jgi:hypothetical protein